MQATNEDKALEILRLIFSGRLDKENSKAVKQVADIIGRKYSDISTGENTKLVKANITHIDPLNCNSTDPLRERAEHD